jgi:hypothetical protein
VNGSRSLGYTEKSQGRVTSLTSTWSEAVCFLLTRLDAAARVPLEGSAAGGRSSTERPCGRGGPRWPRPTATRTATTLENGEKATPVTYKAAGAWRGAVQRKATPVTYSKTDATVEAGSRRASSVAAASCGTRRLAP